MRILLATDHVYLPQRVGGSESSTHDLALTLREHGVEVAVLAKLKPSGWLGLRNRLARRLFGGGRFPADRIMGYPVFRGWQPLEAAREIKEKIRPSVAIIQAGTSVLLARAFLDAGVPTIIYLRDVFFAEMGGPLPRHPRLRYLAVSRFVAEQARARFGVEAVVLPPLVRPERYRTETTRERVLFVNPVAIKGVEIAFRLAESRPAIPFEFVECWPLPRHQVHQYRQRAQRAGNIRWRTTVQDMRRVYGHAKLLLFPSLCDEASGRTVVEAQVSGIPVLASHRGGLPESVGPGGILRDPEAPIARWLEALDTLWSDPASYSQAALKHAQRPEIQPAPLTQKLLAVVREHLAHCAALDASSAAAASGGAASS